MREGFTYNNEKILGYRIKSICPAPVGLVAYFDTNELDQRRVHKAHRAPVSCLALVEMVNEDTGETWQEVRAMITCDQQDALDFAGESDNFLTISHEERRVGQ